MRVLVCSVGKVRGIFAEPLAEYEERVRRYYSFDAVEVKEEPYRKPSDWARVRETETKRLIERIPQGLEVVALHRTGRHWSSEELSAYLAELALNGAAGAAFVIGGALGLSESVLHRGTRQLSLSNFTLPHELARLVLTEQLYRAGTISRGEPYHRGRES